MNYKFIAIFLISLFLFSNISQLTASDDKSYNINHANFILDIHDNGLLHVRESLDYSFDGEFNGVYRKIPLKEGQSIENVTIQTDGAYNDYEITNEDGYYTIKIYLYSNEAKTQKISNSDVKVNIEYDFKKAIKVYNDVGELQYKLWGEEWDQGADKIDAMINFKSSDGVKYWINPYYNDASASWSNNTLIIKSGYVYSGDYLEIRSTIPLSQFSNPVYANKINQDGLSEIEKVQNDYKNEIETEETLYSAISIFLILSLFVPFLIYFKYGREPKVSYDGIYEREPPNNYSPLFVNAMFEGNVGTIDKKAFQSGVMDLINKKYLKLFDSSENEIKLKINYESDFSKLEDYQQGIINILKDFEIDGIINYNEMSKSLKNESNAKRFAEKYDLWKSDFEKIHVDTIIYKYFIDDGHTYLRVFSVILAIVSIIVFFFASDSLAVSAGDAISLSILTFVVAVVCFILPNKIAGRWTKEGMEEDKKWQNFKKYLNDFSLLKEYPPSSIVIWNEFLVYATAMGVAKNVKKAMDFHVPTDSLDNDDIYIYHSHGGSIMLYSAMSTGFSTANPDSSGGVGGVGGGSGGGGGGAF